MLSVFIHKIIGIKMHSHNHINTSSLHGNDGIEEPRLIRKVVTIGCCVNILLMALKLVFGYCGHSAALVADGYHSLVDVATDLIMLTFVSISFRRPSRNYEYGFGKFETFASMMVSGLLLAVSVMISLEAIESIKGYIAGEVLPRPDIWALLAIITAIVGKEFLFRYYHRTGKRTRSNALVSSAWHHRSDALASLAALIGVSFAHFLGENWRVLDPVASLVIVVFILVPAFRLFVPALRELMEGSLPVSYEERAKTAINGVGGGFSLVEMKTRKSGPFLIFDITVAVDGSITVKEGEEIAEKIENSLKGEFGQNIRVSVCIIPE